LDPGVLINDGHGRPESYWCIELQRPLRVTRAPREKLGAVAPGVSWAAPIDSGLRHRALLFLAIRR
ncbi:MAG: hypothetical protein O7C01_07445, partial [Actinobacteria bacterium]|nr:hypothetical protein [Actinomycetota bacterium]